MTLPNIYINCLSIKMLVFLTSPPRSANLPMTHHHLLFHVAFLLFPTFSHSSETHLLVHTSIVGPRFVIWSLWLPPKPFTPQCGLHTPHLRGDELIHRLPSSLHLKFSLLLTRHLAPVSPHLLAAPPYPPLTASASV